MTKIFKKIIVGLSAVLFGIALFVLPFSVNLTSAQTKSPTNTSKQNTTTASTKACDDLKAQLSRGGFDVESQLPKYCSTGSIYTKFITGAMYSVGIVAVIVIIYGGYMYMTAAGNDEQRKKGRAILTWAVIGLVVVILAVVLVNIAVKLLVEK